ncbi:MAG: hypothetical protein NVSMB6_13890 [Burkholderiaceae bacterium]
MVGMSEHLTNIRLGTCIPDKEEHLVGPASERFSSHLTCGKCGHLIPAGGDSEHVLSDRLQVHPSYVNWSSLFCGFFQIFFLVER